MAEGTPVITNRTGDIELYVKNGVNGYIVDEEDELMTTMLGILSQSMEKREKIRKAARETALASFSIKSYEGVLESFICEVSKNAGK